MLEETVDSKGVENEEKINSVVDAYRSIRRIWDLDNAFTDDSLKISRSKPVSIFSDCLVISFEAKEPSEVFHTLLEVKHLIMRLLWSGILCRGAVSLGKFIHTPEYLFGPALVEAYLLETKAALYPRVILDRPVIETGAKYHASHHSSSTEEGYVESLLEIDSDGMYYIDYFHKAQQELDDPEFDFPDCINNLGDIIRKGLMGSSHHGKADQRVKYSWMRERYNRMVDNIHKSGIISRLEQAGDMDLAGAYQDLRPISPNKNITRRSKATK